MWISTSLSYWIAIANEEREAMAYGVYQQKTTVDSAEFIVPENDRPQNNNTWKMQDLKMTDQNARLENTRRTNLYVSTPFPALSFGPSFSCIFTRLATQ